MVKNFVELGIKFCCNTYHQHKDCAFEFVVNGWSNIRLHHQLMSTALSVMQWIYRHVNGRVDCGLFSSQHDWIRIAWRIICPAEHESTLFYIGIRVDAVPMSYRRTLSTLFATDRSIQCNFRRSGISEDKISFSILSAVWTEWQKYFNVDIIRQIWNGTTCNSVYNSIVCVFRDTNL